MKARRVMTMPLIVLAFCAIVLQRRAHAGLAMAARLPHWRTGARLISARLIQPMLFVSLVLVAAGIGLGIVLYRRAGVQIESSGRDRSARRHRSRLCFVFSKTRCGWTNFTTDRDRVQPRFPLASPIGWIATSGMVSCARLGASASSLEFSPRTSMSAASTPGSMKLRPARAAWAGHVELALGANPNLSRRRRRRHARAAASLRMAGLITALFLIPLLGALFVSVAPQNYARGIALGCNGSHRNRCSYAVAKLRSPVSPAFR